jgi:hypothetical protein
LVAADGAASAHELMDQAPVSVSLPRDWWRFIREARSLSTSVPLPADVQAILHQPPRIEIGGPIPEARYIVTMTRPQAEALQRWLHSLYDGLRHDDNRRLTCLMCISRVAVALMLSER